MVCRGFCIDMCQICSLERKAKEGPSVSPWMSWTPVPCTDCTHATAMPLGLGLCYSKALISKSEPVNPVNTPLTLWTTHLIRRSARE